MARSLGIWSIIFTVAASAPLNVSFPAARPTGALKVPANFVGFGFETAFLNNYTNSFSQNLIQSIGNRMSLPTVIRVGGTSGDLVVYNASLQQNTSCIASASPAGACPDGSTATFQLGPSYFAGFTAFNGSKMSFQAPLASESTSMSLAYVTRAFNALGYGRTAAIAIGNEVNSEGFTGASYASRAMNLEQSIISTLNLPAAQQMIFEVLDLASGAVQDGSPPTLQDTFNAGINNNSLVKVAAEHYYQVDGNDPFTGNIQLELMNHTAITSKLNTYLPSINYLANNQNNLPLILSETGSSLQGDQSYSGAFGACMWSVDFHLYAMSIGVRRVHGTQRPVSAHSLWVPHNLTGPGGRIPTPQVRAPFYAQPFIADFVGNTLDSQFVVNMDLNSPYFTAYAMYENTALARVALVNLRFYTVSSGSARGLQRFALSVPDGVTSVVVQTLHADAGAEAQGADVQPVNTITWAGEQWSYTADDGNGHVSDTVNTTISVQNGIATIPVNDTEAVIVYIPSM